MVTITKEPKPRLEPIILSPEHQIEVQKIMTNPYRSSTRSTKMGRIFLLYLQMKHLTDGIVILHTMKKMR